ncbi:MAG TPA: SAM-dependent methyltransferase [Leptolyngbya sp.]|jgi:2-polyprenyl-3-methyl-5-hydroxy-6-metoxy-1,4-benzoquinol methylase|nr:SAM-dependent methyltransferase [Leptolyngbya sp.]
MQQLKQRFNSAWLKFSFNTLFQIARDPWQYTSPYETWKYQQELKLLPSIPILQALELGCAEGIFTVQLAMYVEQLVAADISSVAIARATQRCVSQQCQNVRLIEFDLTQDQLPTEQFDLIVCSEILYYMGDRAMLRNVAKKLAQALKPNGCLITSNDYRVSYTEAKSTKKSRVFGAEVIGAVLSETSSLQLIKVIRTPSYCTHLFQRSLPNRTTMQPPEIVTFTEADVPPMQTNVFDWFSIAKIATTVQQFFKA